MKDLVSGWLIKLRSDRSKITCYFKKNHSKIHDFLKMKRFGIPKVKISAVIFGSFKLRYRAFQKNGGGKLENNKPTPQMHACSFQCLQNVTIYGVISIFSG